MSVVPDQFEEADQDREGFDEAPDSLDTQHQSEEQQLADGMEVLRNAEVKQVERPNALRIGLEEAQGRALLRDVEAEHLQPFAEAESEARATEHEKRLDQLEELRAQAETEVQRQVEVEQQLNAGIAIMRRAAAEQTRRVELAEVEAQQLAAEQAQQIAAETEMKHQLLANAETEAQRLAALKVEVAALRKSAVKRQKQIEKLEAGIKEKQTQITLALEQEERLAALQAAAGKTLAKSIEGAEREAQLTAQLITLRQAEAAQVKRLHDLEVRLDVEQKGSRLAAENRIAELQTLQLQLETETQQRLREHRPGDQIGAIRKDGGEQQSPGEPAKAKLQIREAAALEYEPVLAAQILDEKTPNALEQTHAGEVGFAISDSFVITEEEGAEEEIILGNAEFAPLEVTSQHESGKTALEPMASDAEDEKSILPIGKEAGIVAVNADPSAVSLAAARLISDDPSERSEALGELARLDENGSFDLITRSFDDPSTQVRNAAARALCDLKPDRAASFTRALREAQPDRRRRIGSALAASGLASEAINCLAGESREVTYDAFTILFLMAKAGEVRPLIETIENHADLAVRLAVIKLLAFSNHAEVIAAFRRLAVRGSLPAEVRSAVMEAIHEISTQNRQQARSAA